jgi:hypothetical protein
VRNAVNQTRSLFLITATSGAPSQQRTLTPGVQRFVSIDAPVVA